MKKTCNRVFNLFIITKNKKENHSPLGLSLVNTVIKIKLSRFIPIIILLSILFPTILFPIRGYAENESTNLTETRTEQAKFVLKSAVMCERIKGSTPINTTVIFSAEKERVFCFTVFDPVFSETQIIHNWYFKDDIVSRYKLAIKPNRWETFSTHKISHRVKGPWQLEITDDEGNIITILRFSVTD